MNSPTPPLHVRASTGGYPVVVEPGALARLPAWLTELGIGGRLWLISDSAVLPHYGAALAEPLRAAGYHVQTIAVPAGESSKSLGVLDQLYTWMIGGGVERRDAVLALGGGVVGDLAGFAAASVLRGIAVIQLPTTLLAMVDSAVGGKTGINHPLGKNLIGAFHPPRLVLADTETLATLPPRELRAGMAEVVKHGVIRDAGLFDLLEQRAADAQGAAPIPADLIRRAVAVKVEVVTIDEREQGERMTLNYGHTLGHAIEQLCAYRLLHGECVAIGMELAARIAAGMGLCDMALVERQRRLLAAYGLDVALPEGLDPDAILALTTRDKKVQAGRIRWVLPTAIGTVVIRNDVPEDLVRATLAQG